MIYQSSHSGENRFYWEELSPVPDIPINVYIVRGENTLAPMHTHAYLEIALVVSGTGKYNTSQGEYSIKRGDLFLLSPEHSHSYTCQDNLVVYNLLLKESSVLNPHLELSMDPALRVFFELEPRFRHNNRFQKHVQLSIEQVDTLATIIEQMKEELNNQGPHFKNMLTLLLQRFLILLCRYYPSVIDDQNDHLFAIANVLQYIDMHISSRITCKALANLANMTPKSFYRYFKASTGMAPNAYLLKKRLKHALQLLEESSLSIKQIADQCGFFNTSYFGQQFRKTYAQSPAQIRKKPPRS